MSAAASAGASAAVSKGMKGKDPGDWKDFLFLLVVAIGLGVGLCALGWLFDYFFVKP